MRSGRSMSGGRSCGRQTVAVVATLVAAVAGGCHGDGGRSAGAERQTVVAAAANVGATGAQIVAAIQAQASSPVQAAVAQSFKNATAGGLQPQFPSAAVAAEAKPASVVLPQVASGAMHLQDAASGVTVDFSFSAALPIPAQTVGGYIVYPAALG